jgi:hypothetical protein
MNEMPDHEVMKETVHRRAKRSSWRGTYNDLRADINFVHDLVSRRAPGDDTRTEFSVDLEGGFLEGRSRTYSSLDALMTGLANLNLRTVTQIVASVSNSAVRLRLTLNSDRDGVEAMVSGNAVDAEGVRSEIDHHLARRESTPKWVRALVPEILWVGVAASLLAGEIWSLSGESPWRLAFLCSALFLILGLAVRVIFLRTYPRLEIIMKGEARSTGLKNGLLIVAGYVGAAVVGALADRLIG